MTDSSSGPDPFTLDAGPYVLGALDPAARTRFERHLRDCADCSKAVAQIAGLPALLAAVPVDVAERLLAQGDDALAPAAVHRTDTPPPPWLLDSLIARAKADQSAAELASRRRRRLLVMAAAAAVAVLVSVAGLVAALGGEDSGGRPGDVQVLALEPVDDAPLTVTARLASVAWGTRIELDCRYSGNGSAYSTPPTYALVVLDDAGATEQVATWRAVEGRDVTVEAASAVPRERISALEVRTADGRTVLRVDS